MKKILFPQWDSLGENFVLRAWRAAGYEVDIVAVPMAEPDQAKRNNLAESLVKRILAGAYDFVFTANYLPVIAIACKACRVRYMAWVYDSPCIELYSETIHYETNRVFIFDRQICFDLRQNSVRTVAYLPMAADVDYYDSIEPATNSRYNSELSFVGSLYSLPKPQFAPLERETGYLKGYLDGLVTAQAGLYGCNFLEQALTPRVVMEMQKLCLLPQRVESSETIAWIYANYYLARKVTSKERTSLLQSLSRKFPLRLYSDEDTAAYPEIQNFGMVDYYTQAPQVYKGSKINLNISLRSIQSGIPLRAFDIMGCGGFLLTNYQADLMEHFVPDEDFVYYEGQEDLADKVAYYLEHEEERKEIAANGYEKVKQFHTYRHRIAEILQALSHPLT